MNNKVFIIRPVQRSSMQGRNLQRAVLKDKQSGTILSEHTMNKVKATQGDGYSCTDTLRFRRPDYNRNVYDAGLNDQSPNPFYESKKEDREEVANKLLADYGLCEEWRDIVKVVVKSKTITKQQELEIRFLGSMPPGTLTQAVPNERLTSFRGIIDPKAKRTKLMDFKLTLFDRGNRFTTDNLRGCLAWQLANHHPKIAKNIESVNPAQHWWYIGEEFQDEKMTQDLNNKIDDVIFRLVSLKRKYPITEVLEENVLYFIGSLLVNENYKPLFKGKITSMRLNEIISDYIKTKRSVDTTKFFLDKFNEIVDLFENNPTLFYAKYLTRTGLNTTTLQINNGKVYWLSKKDTPDVYNFTSVSAFEKFIYEELQSPESTYLDSFLTELKNKFGIVPRALQE